MRLRRLRLSTCLKRPPKIPDATIGGHRSRRHRYSFRGGHDPYRTRDIRRHPGIDHARYAAARSAPSFSGRTKGISTRICKRTRQSTQRKRSPSRRFARAPSFSMLSFCNNALLCCMPGCDLSLSSCDNQAGLCTAASLEAGSCSSLGRSRCLGLSRSACRSMTCHEQYAMPITSGAVIATFKAGPPPNL